MKKLNLESKTIETANPSASSIINNTKKALELKPENNCHWCENSQGKLKQLNN